MPSENQFETYLFISDGIFIMTSPITIATYNIHKGMSPLNRKVQLTSMGEALQTLNADILFLQEVQGMNILRQEKLADFPHEPHHDFLGNLLNFNRSYGKNAVFSQKHHGNAILSHLPIETQNNLNITVNRLEKRGVLHCEIQPQGWDVPIVCLCAHLNLREADRVKQYIAIFEYVTTYVHPDSPLILAGDFNDWQHKASLNIGKTLGLTEVFMDKLGKYPKTFPARLPILSLDRIYTRHLDILSADVHNTAPWTYLSDHLPLSAVVKLK